MKELIRDFISEEKRRFKFRIGDVHASALSGFIAGVISATIILATIVYIFQVFQK